MIFLFSALFFSLLIIVIFKIFSKYGISVSQAIAINYLVAAIFGFSTIGKSPSFSFYFESDFLHVAIISGIFFILVFNVFALSAEKAGVAITAVSSKMSVIIPVIMGTIIFRESFSLLKILGVILVMLSFYLVFRKKEGYGMKRNLIILPLLLFLGNGTNDTILKYAQFNFIDSDQGFVHYLTIVFSVSFVLGFVFLLVKTITGKIHFGIRHIIAGIILGICNWFSTLFFLKGLGSMDVSVFIPVFNAGLVSLAALTGVFAFKEKLTTVNIIGIAVSLIAITMIAYAN